MGKLQALMRMAKAEAEKPATRWRVRWRTPDGMYTFAQIHRAGAAFTRAEVEAWGAEQVRLHPGKYASVAMCYPVPDDEA